MKKTFNAGRVILDDGSVHKIIRAVLLFLASTSVAIGETAILRAPDPECAALLDFPGMRRAPSPEAAERTA